jgi:hypothetical protein
MRQKSTQAKESQNRESDDLTSSARALKAKIRARGIQTETGAEQCVCVDAPSFHPTFPCRTFLPTFPYQTFHRQICLRRTREVERAQRQEAQSDGRQEGHGVAGPEEDRRMRTQPRSSIPIIG